VYKDTFVQLPEQSLAAVSWVKVELSATCKYGDQNMEGKLNTDIKMSSAETALFFGIEQKLHFLLTKF
jgi:hypothetical protein